MRIREKHHSIHTKSSLEKGVENFKEVLEFTVVVLGKSEFFRNDCWLSQGNAVLSMVI